MNDLFNIFVYVRQSEYGFRWIIVCVICMITSKLYLQLRPYLNKIS